MDLTLLDEALWAAGFFGNAALFAVLLYRRRWKGFSFFTAWICFQLVVSAVLLILYRYAPSALYADAYWVSDGVDFIIQLLVIYEIAGIVLKPTGSWLKDARYRFLMGAAIGIVVAIGIIFLVNPSSPSIIGKWDIRANLFTSLVICEIYLAMLASATRLGLQWRNHVMGLGQGLSLWAAVSFLVDAGHSVLGRVTDYTVLENTRSAAWIVAALIWITVFLRPEPERLPLSPELQSYLIELHSRVRYDLQQSNSRSQ
jgi:hypothetical protein